MSVESWAINGISRPYSLPSQLRKTSQKRNWKDCKSQRSRKTKVQRCLLDPKGCSSHELIALRLSAQDPVSNAAAQREGLVSPSLAEEPLTTDGCWVWEHRFSLLMWSWWIDPVDGPTPCIHKEHWMDLVDPCTKPRCFSVLQIGNNAHETISSYNKRTDKKGFLFFFFKGNSLALNTQGRMKMWHLMCWQEGWFWAARSLPKHSCSVFQEIQPAVWQWGLCVALKGSSWDPRFLRKEREPKSAKNPQRCWDHSAKHSEWVFN